MVQHSSWVSHKRRASLDWVFSQNKWMSHMACFFYFTLILYYSLSLLTDRLRKRAADEKDKQATSKEIRLLRRLLRTDDAKEREAIFEEAFTPKDTLLVNISILFAGLFVGSFCTII
jgi:hypothetical protein